MNKVQNQKILVTGGAGFIGSNLIKTLLKQNNTVVCLDNFSTGKRKNIEQFECDNDFTLIKGDIRNLETCLTATEKVDYVLHQAALGSVPRSLMDPVTTNEVNISGFLNMLVAAKQSNIKRFVYAASSSTYGDSKELPKREENIGKPLSPYAITKYVNELYAQVFSDNYGLSLTGLRYFNVFGPSQDPDGAYAAVIPKFIKRILSYEAPTINGDGETSRDFTYVENVIQMNQLALLATDESACNTVYNVACGERTTLNQLFAYIRDYLGNTDEKIKKLDALYGPERIGDVRHSLASIDKAKSLLGYSPEIFFREGLERTLDWYIDNESASETKISQNG